MTVETRYMRSDQQTVNGLLAYILGTAQTISYLTNTQTVEDSQYYVVTWGIRVWKRNSAGTETEITAGTPVAQVSRSTSAEGIQSNTWACPLTALNSTDAIVVRVYINIGGFGWTEQASFITEQLEASQLDSVTWTVYYYTYRSQYAGSPKLGLPAYTRGRFYWGSSTYNSRIENFTWTAVVVVVKKGLMDGFVLVS